MEEPHNYRKVGYSMILVAASLVVIALLYVAIGEDVLYSDRVAKQKQLEHEKFLEEQKQKMEQAENQGKSHSVELREQLNVQNP